VLVELDAGPVCHISDETTVIADLPVMKGSGSSRYTVTVQRRQFSSAPWRALMATLVVGVVAQRTHRRRTLTQVPQGWELMRSDEFEGGTCKLHPFAILLAIGRRRESKPSEPTFVRTRAGSLESRRRFKLPSLDVAAGSEYWPIFWMFGRRFATT
jgi:hypothetical protein